MEERNPAAAAASRWVLSSRSATSARLEVDVGLVEAVEQHQRVRAAGPASRHVGHRAEERAELDRDGDASPCRFTAAGCRRSAPRPPAADGQVGRDVVDVQLQRVGAGLLDLAARSRSSRRRSCR